MNNNIFEIMHKDRRVARIDYSSGRCKIYYYIMNIVDYIVGNTDRHWGNGGSKQCKQQASFASSADEF